MTRTGTPEIDWTIQCICDAWLMDGEVWTLHKEKRESGFDPKCEFHQVHPEVFYDRDTWADLELRTREAEVEV